MSTPVQKNQDGGDLKLHAPKLPPAQPAEDSPSTVPDANGPREASGTPWSPPSLWPRSDDSPPTAPDARNEARPQPKVQATQLRPQSAPRMPQGLGGPNLAAPSGPMPPRVSHSAPPGVDGIDAVWPPRGPQAPEFEGDLAIKALRQRLSLDPELVPSPPIRRRSTSFMPAVGRLSLVVLVAGMVAGGVALLSDTRPDVVAMFKRDVFNREVFNRDTGAAAAPMLAAAESTPAQVAPRLIVEGRQTFANEALALGISLNGAAGSEFALLTGLANGTKLSVGGPFGSNGWRIPAQELGTAMAYAPKDFVGVMEASIDLRMPNNTLIDSQFVRLEWVPKQPEVRARPVVRPEREEPRPAPVVFRPIDTAEADLLIKRAQDYLKTGDIVSARLALRRVAGAGNAQAALTLGASFDPIVFEEMGVLGFAADVAQARRWYQQAAELGSSEAKRRLERLAKMVP
jgi:hypothetical protein